MADGWNEKIIEEFRANDGKVGGIFEGADLLILHTTGAKSGAERQHPLMYRTDGDNLVVFASKGGAPEHPAWFHNVRALPMVQVELGTETKDAVARVAEGDERERLWSAQKQDRPQFAEYEEKTDRTIPVVVLEPIR